MKFNLTITAFTDDISSLLKWVEDTLTYDKLSIGLHKNSSREHHHIGVVLVDEPSLCKDMRKYYNRKGLKEFPYDIKLSITYDPTEEDHKKCLAYPLKEYESYDEIKYIDKIKETIDETTLEGYRVFANSIYSAVVYKNEKKQEQLEKNNQSQIDLQHYLFQNLKQNEDWWKKQIPAWNVNYEITELYCKLYELCLDYHLSNYRDALNKITCRWSDVPNFVLSFMYRNMTNDDGHSDPHSPLCKKEIILFREKIKISKKTT